MAFAAIAPASALAAAVATNLVIRGADGQKVRPFSLKRDADVFWTCRGCNNSNFIFTTDQGLPVNALNQTQGRSFLERGRYTGVQIIASGPWTIQIRTTASRPLRSTYTLTGAGGQNVRPFTLTHDSDLIWACPSCSDSNFIISTDQGLPVNALNRTRGRSFLERGRYTGVTIAANGPWKIVLR